MLAGQPELPMRRALSFCLLSLCLPVLARPVLAEPPLPVHVVTAHTEPVTRDFVLAGTLQATDTYPAAFRDGGRVIEVAADVGDRVAQGAVLARLDPTQANAALRAAEAGLGGAEAALLQAGQARDRARNLLAHGTGTQADLDAATEAWLSATATRDQALAARAKAQRAVEDTVLRAVADAIVITRSAEPGQVTGAGQAAFVLAMAEGREAVFLVPDGIDLEARLGSTVSLSPIDRPDEIFHATLTEVSPIVAANGTVRVKAATGPDLPADLVIGSAVLGHAAFDEAARMSLPWTALTAGAAGPAVWVVGADGGVTLTPVDVAGYADDAVEINGGLPEGARVVTDGAQQLYPGRQVVEAGAQP